MRLRRRPRARRTPARRTYAATVRRRGEVSGRRQSLRSPLARGRTPRSRGTSTSRGEARARSAHAGPADVVVLRPRSRPAVRVSAVARAFAKRHASRARRSASAAFTPIEEERVVVRVRVARPRNVPSEVEAVREAAARKLCDEREQTEREHREEPVVSNRCRESDPPRQRWSTQDSVSVHSGRCCASSEKRRIRCHWPRQSAPSVNGTCSERGPRRSARSRSRRGELSLGTTRSSSASRSSKKPVSRSCTRTSESVRRRGGRRCRA